MAKGVQRFEPAAVAAVVVAVAVGFAGLAEEQGFVEAAEREPDSAEELRSATELAFELSRLFRHLQKQMQKCSN